ncbi:MAG TPA: carboxypeptidase-like regulatory domain-containing protein [Bryobacteraceae bacterium]|nr:carboxypeptidase-like regulatory domain-containing protein [Bryobacteraceae bacterium]
MWFRWFLVTVGAVSPLWAQIVTLHGTVTDPSGAVVPGAKVTVTAADGASKAATTDKNGAYTFSGLQAGTYTVRASARDFSQPEPAAIALKAGIQTLHLQLTLAAVQEQVTVQDSPGPTVSTDAANNASAVVLRGDDLQALSDDPDDLQSDLQALAGPSAGPSGGAIFVDGFSGAELPPKESIREVRINQNPFSAEFDKLGYGRVEVFTKPGADRYRGTVDYNLGTDYWNTRNPYAPEKAPFLLNEIEGNVGGPLSHRASFFLDFQRNVVDNGFIFNAVTVDPKTFAIQPFAGFISTPQRFLRLNPRIDHQLTDKLTATVRYSYTHAEIPDDGVGGLDLPARGYRMQYTNQLVQATATAVLGSTINETRFQYNRNAQQIAANSAGPEMQVLGAFNGGGSQFGQTFDTFTYYEAQNNTYITHSTHSIRVGFRVREQVDQNIQPLNFNGTFTFGGGDLEPVLDATNQPVAGANGQPLLAPITSIERYRRTLLFQSLGYTASQIRALGGGATQFSINAGQPALTVSQFDLGAYATDDWRVRPNLTLSLGLRYEVQTNIHDWRDLGPRIAVAWAPGAGGPNARATTVLRAGFGIFYDRFALANTLAAERYDGIVQQQYVITNPDFFPEIPPAATLAGFRSTQVIQEVSRSVRAPYTMQSGLTLERQLPANTTLAVTYANSHGVHVLRSNDINAPLPGIGAFPYGVTNPIFLMESSGLYNQNQLIVNLNSRINAGFSLFGFYVLNRAMSNSDGVGTFPANPYNFSGEYGPAITDVRHRITTGGSINFRWNIRVSPFVVAQTGAPFNLTAGSDLYGTTLFNGRPGVATDPSKPGLIETPYGLLDPRPSAGEALIGRNAGRGPGQIGVNLRIAKSVGFGARKESAAKPPASVPAGTGGAVAAPASGGGLRGIIGDPSSGHRYNLSIGLSVRNLLNHTNPGPIIGNITSPLFGSATQIAGGPNGEGFYENANNRRLEMQLRFTF